MKNITVLEVYEELYKRHYSKPRFIASRYGKEVAMNWRNHLEKPFGYRLVSKVTPPAVHMWHHKYEDSPYAGNRSKSVLSKIFTFAEMRGYIPAGSNPCRCVPSHPEKKRRRFATDEEMKAVAKILREEEMERPRAVAFIRILMLTGSRPSGLERATWNGLKRHKEGGVFVISGKTGEEHITLTQDALKIIDNLPKDSHLVFGIKFPRKFWERVRDEAGCPDLWAYDWRRTFATTGLSDGEGIGAIGELLNHKSQQTTMRYAKLTHSASFRIAEKIGRAMARKIQELGAQ